jgi:hypothetical protein
MDALVTTLGGAGISRAEVRLWSAHYGQGKHICGPGTCGLTRHACDGTQWTDAALGRSLDESILLSDFFSPSGWPARSHPSRAAPTRPSRRRARCRVQVAMAGISDL